MGKQGEKLTVLFASGDEFLKEQVVEVLDKEKHEIVLVDHCKDLLEKLLESNFDAVIFDHDLKKLDNIEAIEIFKKIRPKLPLIVLSELIPYDSEVKIAKLGVHFRLSKPIDKEVTKALFDSLERHRGEKD